MKKAFAFILILIAANLLSTTAFAGTPLTVETLLKLYRLGDPQVSPDGAAIVYQAMAPDLAANTRPNQIWSVAINGGTPKQITHEGSQNTRPRWSPDGKRIAFISDRGGSSQIWTMAPDGSDAKQVTRISSEADGETWSPDGRSFLFISDVYPECKDDACNQARAEERAKSKVKAHLVNRLLYRHWTTWKDGKRSHLFLVTVEGMSNGSVARDLTPGDYDVPPFSMGDPDGYAFSPDSREVAYASNHDPVEATSTNNDLFLLSLAPGASARQITTNPGADTSPVYSPDGRWIAYRAQLRAGAESDRFRLMLYERASGKITNLTENYDRWVLETTWSPDSKTIYFVTEDTGTLPIMAIPVAGGQPRAVVSGAANGDVSVTADGRALIFTRASMKRPNEVYTAPASGGELRAVTHMNDEFLSGVELTTPEAFWFPGAGGTKVHGWLLRPPNFDASKKYPVAVILHGGPETGFDDAWSFRWNTQVFAGAGYVVVMINRRGSTGFGQKFIDDILRDWGGKPYEDVMKGVDYVLAKYPFADGTRMGASGGSYGGYMANWIAGHTDRFKCIVSHAGLFNLASMYGATEELWFPETEFGGTPWQKPEVYRQWSPSEFVRNFKTPTLVVHNDMDFRVPIGEGMQMFTALQRMKVPSEYLNFPDEGHWVGKPQNSLLWYKTVIAWWDRWQK